MIDVPVVQVVQLPRWWSQLQFSDTLVTCPLLSITGAWGLTVTKNCGGPAVTVLIRSSMSLSWCRGRLPWSSCSEDHGDSAVAVFFLVVDAPVVQRRRGTHSALVQKTELFPLVQFLGKVVAPVLCNDRGVVRWCCMRYRQRYVINTPSEPPPPPSKRRCFGSSVAFLCDFLLKPKRVASSWLHATPLFGVARDG